MYAGIRNQALRFLTSRCRIEQEMTATGAMREQVRSWAVVANDVPCRVMRGNVSRQDATSAKGDVEALPETYRIALPVGTAVAVDYRLVLSSQTYYVVGIEKEFTDEFFHMVTAVIRR